MTSLKDWIDTKIKDGVINYFEYNNFTFTGEIGEGAFGIVKRADWCDGGIKVALKSLLKNQTIDENQKKYFLREVKINITKILKYYFIHKNLMFYY